MDKNDWQFLISIIIALLAWRFPKKEKPTKRRKPKRKR